MTSAILSTSKLCKRFGGLQAVSDLDLAVGAGEIVGLIGPNGSGKTTTINVLTGLYAATSGSVMMAGRELTGEKPSTIVKSGLARTFQNLRLFTTRSVLDNVRAAQTVHTRGLARLGATLTTQEKHLREEAGVLIRRFRLDGRENWPAGTLSYGEKKRLEIARALATRPKILLLDEPAAGMNPVELDWLRSAISEIRASGIGIVLIEHHMKLVMSLCDRVVVLNFGRKIAEGTPAAIAQDSAVIEAYLGKAREC